MWGCVTPRQRRLGAGRARTTITSVGSSLCSSLPSANFSSSSSSSLFSSVLYASSRVSTCRKLHRTRRAGAVRVRRGTTHLQQQGSAQCSTGLQTLGLELSEGVLKLGEEILSKPGATPRVSLPQTHVLPQHIWGHRFVRQGSVRPTWKSSTRCCSRRMSSWASTVPSRRTLSKSPGEASCRVSMSRNA